MGEGTEGVFRQSIQSILTQLYADWELCIAADDRPFIQTFGSSAAAQDPRIHFVHDRPELALGGAPVSHSFSDGGSGIPAITTATNAALKAATGEFVTFLRAGDILPENALYEVVVVLLMNPSLDILYTDYDEVDGEVIRSKPWFKPGWDPDLLLAHDYLNDLTVYRRALLEKVGFLRPEFAGAEFYDLALRATAATTPDRIFHLPALLYHRRNTLKSQKGLSSGVAAVRDRLITSGYKEAAIEPAPQMPEANRIIWPLPKPLPLVSVIIPTRDRAELLARCVEGVLKRTDYTKLELLIVDNDSTEPATLALFAKLIDADKRVRVLHYPGKFNYSALNNVAAREAQGEVLLFLNNDIDVIEPGWLREMVSHAVRPDVGMVGAKLLFADERIQHAGVVFAPGGKMYHLYRLAEKDEAGYFGQLALTRTFSAVTAACAAARKSVFREAGGFNENNLAVAFNDIDLCLRLGDLGYRILWTPFAKLFHLESASRGPDDDPVKKAQFLREWEYMRRTWGSLLDTEDPFHNPNLLFTDRHVEIPSAPRRTKPWKCNRGT